MLKTAPLWTLAVAVFVGVSASSCRSMDAETASQTAAAGPSLPAGGDIVVMGTMTVNEASSEAIPVTVTADRDSASFLVEGQFEVVNWNGEVANGGERAFINEHYAVRVRFPDDSSEGDATITSLADDDDGLVIPGLLLSDAAGEVNVSVKVAPDRLSVTFHLEEAQLLPTDGRNYNCPCSGFANEHFSAMIYWPVAGREARAEIRRR